MDHAIYENKRNIAVPETMIIKLIIEITNNKQTMC